MDSPRTELDQRFSDRDATPTDWEVTRTVIEEAQLSWISTVRSDGRPHVTPLVAVWLDDAAHFCTGASEQKAVNLAQNPHVVITTGCAEWRRGVDVMVEGRAEMVTDQELLARLAEQWATKWDGSWHFDVVDGGFHSDDGGRALVYRVDPAKVLAFTKGSFSHTRHVPAPSP